MFKLFLEYFYFLSEIGSSKKAGGNVDGLWKDKVRNIVWEKS